MLSSTCAAAAAVGWIGQSAVPLAPTWPCTSLTCTFSRLGPHFLHLTIVCSAKFARCDKHRAVPGLAASCRTVCKFGWGGVDTKQFGSQRPARKRNCTRLHAAMSFRMQL